MAAKKPTQIGNYRVLREIGRGGMGAVYEAEHQRVKNRVAIKVLHPEYCRDPQIVARFRQEPMAANLPRHAGITHVIESEVLDDGTPYIVMEYLDGQSLRQRIRKARSGLPELSVVRFGKQVADALAAAHAKKIVHRDIKPENIMIVRDDAVAGGERAKVLDFGIAVVAEEHVMSSSQNSTQVQTSPFASLLGTATYMAPEQCQGIGRSPVDDKADVYALGVVLYELLTGRPPFQAPELVSVMHMHVTKEPEPVSAHRPEVRPELETLVMRMLGKAPDKRPTMREVSAELTAMERPDSQSLPVLTPPPLPMPSRRATLLGGAAGAAVALVLGWFLLVGPQAATVRWRVTSTPTGAEVLGPDGVRLGKTPLTLRPRRDLGKLQVTLRAAGQAPATLLLDYSEDCDRQVTMSPRSDGSGGAP
jgi:serine/threonine protein kinase